MRILELYVNMIYREINQVESKIEPGKFLMEQANNGKWRGGFKVSALIIEIHRSHADIKLVVFIDCGISLSVSCTGMSTSIYYAFSEEQ